MHTPNSNAVNSRTRNMSPMCRRHSTPNLENRRPTRHNEIPARGRSARRTPFPANDGVCAMEDGNKNLPAHGPLDFDEIEDERVEGDDTEQSNRVIQGTRLVFGNDFVWMTSDDEEFP